jgi:hypothetical protein
MKKIPMRLLAPTSPGDLLDKVSILTIKAERLTDKQRTNVLDELTALREIVEAELSLDGLDELLQELRHINLTLWDTEVKLRRFERQAEFGTEFVDCARSIYKNNDRRHDLKRRINELLGSCFFEEKSYL